jgi:hypothetical protein
LGFFNCKEVRIIPRKKTHEEFVQEIKEKFPNRYDFLTTYDGKDKLITVQRKDCKHVYEIFGRNLYRDSNCPICYQEKNKEHFIHKFNDLFGEEFDIVGDYINANTKIDVKHHKCNSIIPVTPHYIFDSVICNCPLCEKDNNKICIPYVNDIYTTNKELYALLKNKEDGHKYHSYSSKKTWFVCPNCGKEHFLVINRVCKSGVVCDVCSDNISYPEKFMSNILNQLNIEYIRQYQPDWAKPYFYDFYFQLDNKQYIIEMDGAFHYSKNFKTRSLDEIQNIDHIKDNMALKNNHTIIRVDCNYKSITNRCEYITKNICDSYLKNIFNLSIVDFKSCNLYAQSSLVKMVSDKWNNGLKNYEDLADIFKVSDVTVRNYILIAIKIGLISETYEEIKAMNSSHRGILLGNKVKCNETGEIFNSYKEADRKYGSYICAYFGRNLSYSGTLPNGTHLTWTKLENVI